jgi:hypothetical protein
VTGGFDFVRGEFGKKSWKAKLAFQELNLNGFAD